MNSYIKYNYILGFSWKKEYVPENIRKLAGILGKYMFIGLPKLPKIKNRYKGNSAIIVYVKWRYKK